MSIMALLTDLRKQGITLSLDGEQLRCTIAHGEISHETKNKIKKNKEKIISFIIKNNKNHININKRAKLDQKEDLPLSFAQESIWILDKLGGSYNEPIAMRITDTLFYKSLLRSLNNLVLRHEIMRTIFPVIEGIPHSKILVDVNYSLPLLDFTQVIKEERKKYALESAGKLVREDLDLERGPLFKLALFKLSENEWILLIIMHHIICDTWSLNIILQDLIHFYNADLNIIQFSLPELPIQYVDYTYWQRAYVKKIKDEQLQYWKNKFELYESYQRFPTDKKRPNVYSFRGSNKHFTIDTEHSAIKSLCKNFNITQFHFYMTAFIILMQRYIGGKSVSLGTLVSGRKSKELENLIGFFSNTLVLVVKIDKANTFKKLSEAVKKDFSESLDNSDIPFDIIVNEINPKRDLSYNPFFQTMFVYTGVSQQLEVNHGIKAESASWVIDTNSGKFDIVFTIGERDGMITGSVEYCTDLFYQQTIARFINHYINIVKNIMLNPFLKLADINILSEEEVKKNQLKLNVSELGL